MDYFLLIDDETQGPIPEDEIVRRLEDGELDESIIAWHEGLHDWLPLKDLFDIEDEEAEVPPAPQPPADQQLTPDAYLVAKGGSTRGPYTQLELQALVAAGGLRSDALVWTEGMEDWAKLYLTLPGFTPPPTQSPAPRQVVAKSATRPLIRQSSGANTPASVLELMRQQAHATAAAQHWHRPLPLRRFIARSMDATLIYPLSFVIWSAIFSRVTPEAVRNIHSVKDALVPQHLAWIISASIALLILPILIESIMLAAFGATPFKFALGMAVQTDDGKSPSLLLATIRSFKVFVYGLGCHIPLLNLLTLHLSRQYLVLHGQTSWDDSLELMTKRVRRSTLKALGSFMAILAVAELFYFLMSKMASSLVNWLSFMHR